MYAGTFVLAVADTKHHHTKGVPYAYNELGTGHPRCSY